MLLECKKRDIRVILDGVFNHVGMDSKYFNKTKLYDGIGAYNSKDSKYYKWFTFTKYPDKYLCWWDIKLLPAISENCASYVDYICGDGGIIEKYLKMGVDGYRLDVVDELPDEFLDELTKKVKETNKDAIIIGEVWEDASNKTAYGKRRKYFTSNQLDGVMNYVWKNAIIKFIKEGQSNWLYSDVIEIINNYPSKNLNCNMNILGTHDTKRIITELAGENEACLTVDEKANYELTEKQYKSGKKLLKLAAILQFTLCGTPSIYYGDEAGIQGYKDPFNRTTFPWGNEDMELLEFHKTLSKIRENKEYENGNLDLLPYTEGVIAFYRGGKFLTVVNRSDKDFELKGEFINLLTNKKETKVSKNSGGIFIKG